MKKTNEDAVRQWSAIDPDQIVSKWGEVAPRLSVVVAGAQLAAASPADAYVSRTLVEQGLRNDSLGVVQPRAFMGSADDGRGLESLLFRPALTFGFLKAQGVTLEKAWAVGLATLQMIVKTQVAEAGRASDLVAMISRPAATSYTRMTVGTTCDRCAVLAGRTYDLQEPFDRHPQCNCIHVPTQEAISSSLEMNPRELILSGRVSVTQAQRELIEAGSDPAQVINAQRGMYVSRSQQLTTESTTRRGVAPGKIRLMPEEIWLQANGDRTIAIPMLREHGYLI